MTGIYKQEWIDGSVAYNYQYEFNNDGTYVEIHDGTVFASGTWTILVYGPEEYRIKIDGCYASWNNHQICWTKYQDNVIMFSMME